MFKVSQEVPDIDWLVCLVQNYPLKRTTRIETNLEHQPSICKEASAPIVNCFSFDSLPILSSAARHKTPWKSTKLLKQFSYARFT